MRKEVAGVWLDYSRRDASIFAAPVTEDATPEEMEKVKFEGTWENGIRCPVDKDGNWLDPHSRQVTPVEEIRGRQGLRLWENDDLVPRPDDVLQERLYMGDVPNAPTQAGVVTSIR